MSRQIKTDVLIIGSGLGGLLCGALLGRDGYSVTILEKLAFPGGRYTTMDRDGFKINTGAWAVGLHGTSGPLYRLLADLGARVETRAPQPTHIHLWVGDQDVPLPLKGQLGFIIERVSRSEKEAERLMRATRKALRWQEPSDEVTCQQWVYQHTDNPLIHGFFDFFSRGMTGTYYYDFPAGEYFRLLRSFGRYGNLTAMPKNGQKTTVDALLGLLDKFHVVLHTRAKVEKIATNGEKVEGVVAAIQGQRVDIDTQVVISDAGPKETRRLVGEGNLPPDYLKELEAIHETMATVTIFGYDRPMVDYESHIQLIEHDRLLTAWEPCHIWPEYAPAGRQSFYTYSNMKTLETEKELDAIIEQCRTRFPALEKAEVIATLVFKGDWPVLRARPAECLSFRTPIYGLYLAGDAVNPRGLTCGEGISAACVAIGEDIRARFPKPA